MGHGDSAGPRAGGSMLTRTLGLVPVLLLSASVGCHGIDLRPSPDAACTAPAAEGATVHVKAPPQKIVIEQPVCAPPEEAPKGRPESAPAKPPPREGRP